MTTVQLLIMLSYLLQFKADMDDMEDLSQMRTDLMVHAQNIMNLATNYSTSYDTYSYLWVDDRQEFMRQFLLYGHVLTSDEIESHADEGVPENPPTLAQFREQVKTSQFFLGFLMLYFSDGLMD